VEFSNGGDGVQERRMTLNSLPALLKSVEYVCRNVCQPVRFWNPSFSAAGRTYFRKLFVPKVGFFRESTEDDPSPSNGAKDRIAMVNGHA
jgi:hypothetical protein